MNRASLALVLLVASACRDDDPWEGNFDIPTVGAVLQNEVGGPFEEPVGYGASIHGGQIAILALKQGRYLSDDDAASFVSAAPLATGRNRVIGSLAAYAPDEQNIVVYAADRAYGQLLRIPHVVGLYERGTPIRVRPLATDWVFLDADESGDRARLDDLKLRLGYTTTEDWVLEYDGEEWWVTGSRSGIQPRTAQAGVGYAAERRTVEFTIQGSATPGDQFQFSTDSGIEELDLGGIPLQLAMAPDQSRIAAVIEDRDDGRMRLLLFDPTTDTVVEEVPLPADAQPHRLAWAPDAGTLFAADVARPSAWEVVREPEGALSVIEHPLPWPVFDVAPMLSEEQRHLFVAPVGARTVWIFDLDADALVDFNPQQDGVNGLDLDTPVQGLEAIPLRYRWPEIDDEGVNRWGRSVAVSLYTGKVVFMAEGTGCLVRDEFGPRTEPVSQYGSGLDYSANFSNVSGAAFLQGNATNDRTVMVNPCGGIARRETWTITYRQNLQAWEVEGSRSGLQEGLVYEDQRYVSDTGAVSFVIRGGTTVSEEGWRISLTILMGVVEANGNNDEDSGREVEFDLPQDPVFFHYLVGGSDGGWDPIEDRSFVLVPAAGSDLFGRVDPQSGHIDAWWW
ncbi:MAG: hypothetical protein JRJ84_05115 [Deltaproteobacteria bacterium]|nr:hypothetical protein [Deltaproteobacteria bacterium]